MNESAEAEKRYLVDVGFDGPPLTLDLLPITEADRLLQDFNDFLTKQSPGFGKYTLRPDKTGQAEIDCAIVVFSSVRYLRLRNFSTRGQRGF